MSVDKYRLEGTFEASVLFYLLVQKGFAVHFLPHLASIPKAHDELFENPYAAMAVGLALNHFKKHARPPGGLMAISTMVVQMYNRGKITRAERDAAVEYYETLPLYVGMDEETAFLQFGEHIRDWKNYLATKQAFALTQERKPLDDVAKLILEANSVLTKRESVGVSGMANDFALWNNLIKQAGNREKMPTGIDLWDTYLDGGLGRKALGLIIGGTGAGKSVVLSQMCAVSLLTGEDAAYITLEVDPGEVAARIYAPIAGIPITYMVKNPDGAYPYVERTYARTGIKPGRLMVEEFPAGITVAECLHALDQIFERQGWRPRVIYLDYLDRFGGGKTRGAASSYEAGKDITQEIKNYIGKHDMWCWSASQSKRFASKADAREADENSAADSQHKVRISDVVVNLLVNKDGPNGDEIAARISKHRGGKHGQKSEFIPADYTYGVVFPSRVFKLKQKWALASDPNYAHLVEADEREAEDVERFSREKAGLPKKRKKRTEEAA